MRTACWGRSVGRKAGMEEQHQDRIANIAQRFGLTQDEAQIFDHLVEATPYMTRFPTTMISLCESGCSTRGLWSGC